MSIIENLEKELEDHKRRYTAMLEQRTLIENNINELIETIAAYEVAIKKLQN